MIAAGSDPNFHDVHDREKGHNQKPESLGSGSKHKYTPSQQDVQKRSFFIWIHTDKYTGDDEGMAKCRA